MHCAEADSCLQVERRSGYPLADAQADRCVDEHREGARPVGLDPDHVPAAAHLAACFDRVLPELLAGQEGFAVDDFLRRLPVHALLVPARALLRRRVAALGYQALPPYAHELYGRPAPPPQVVDRRLRATGALLRAIPARLRRQLPPGHTPKAMARLGPDSRPTPYKLRGRAAILDGPGRAQQ